MPLFFVATVALLLLLAMATLTLLFMAAVFTAAFFCVADLVELASFFAVVTIGSSSSSSSESYSESYSSSSYSSLSPPRNIKSFFCNLDDDVGIEATDDGILLILPNKWPPLLLGAAADATSTVTAMHVRSMKP